VPPTNWQRALTLVMEYESDVNDADLAVSHSIPLSLIKEARRRDVIRLRRPSSPEVSDPFHFVP
jgi:hypothetical protein